MGANTLNSFNLLIPAAKVPQLKAEAAQHGLDLSQAYGTLPETHGVVLDYQVAYVNGDANVTFTCVKRPPLVTCSMIASRTKSVLGL